MTTYLSVYSEKSSSTPNGVSREKKNFSTKGQVFTRSKKIIKWKRC